MKHSIKKSEIIDRMGLKISLKEYDGPNPKHIKLTENQFDRLLEAYMDYEEFEMGEVFGDGDLELSEPETQDVVTQSADDYYMDTESPSELGEEEEMDEMWGNLAKIAAGAAGTAAVDRLADKYLGEKEEVMESIKKSFKLIREEIEKTSPKGIRIEDYSKNVISESFYGSGGNRHHPGESAAAGIENIINSIKKGYAFVKDSRTRKQIENTLVKLSNFMTYTAELIGSGRDQRAPQSYESLAQPLPYPDLDEPEEMEDIDDEIEINEDSRWMQDVDKDIEII